MPIYEYRCEGCDIKFEKLVMGASTQVACPSCRSAEVEKVPSVFGFSSGGKSVGSRGSSGCESCASGSCSNCSC